MSIAAPQSGPMARIGHGNRDNVEGLLGVSGETIKLASLYAIQLGSTAEEIGAFARDCFNEALSLSGSEAGGLN
jgi:hypothetical protein